MILFQTEDTGQWLAMIFEDAPILIYDLQTGVRLRELDINDIPDGYKLHPSGCFLSSTSLFITATDVVTYKRLVQLDLKSGEDIFLCIIK